MTTDNAYCLLNGQFDVSLHPSDRGLGYGHGLFETMRLHQGKCPFWDYHIARLNRGAAVLGIAVDQNLLKQYWTSLLSSGVTDGLVKLTITAGNASRGYALNGNTCPNYLLQYFPVDQAFKNKIMSYCRNGISVKICQYRLPENKVLAGIKHLNRLDQVLASQEVDQAFHQEGIVRDNEGRVVEGISRNIFLRIGDRWLTPDLQYAGICGVLRQYLMDEVFAELSLNVFTEDVTLNALLTADEIFMCNSITGIWPVVDIVHKAEFKVGEQTRSIQQCLGRKIKCFAG